MIHLALQLSRDSSGPPSGGAEPHGSYRGQRERPVESWRALARGRMPVGESERLGSPNRPPPVLPGFSRSAIVPGSPPCLYAGFTGYSHGNGTMLMHVRVHRPLPGRVERSAGHDEGRFILGAQSVVGASRSLAGRCGGQSAGGALQSKPEGRPIPGPSAPMSRGEWTDKLWSIPAERLSHVRSAQSRPSTGGQTRDHQSRTSLWDAEQRNGSSWVTSAI